MPRVGSREWNRQQNLRRQREQDQIIQASIVVEQAEQVVIDAEPFECRRDVLQLREQIQNKITQIEQLKTNTKEFKKQIKKLKKENEELKKNNLSFLAEKLIDLGYVSTKNKLDVDLEYNADLVGVKYRKEGESINFDMGSTKLLEKTSVQKYIKYLEAIVMSNNTALATIGKGYNFESFYTMYNSDKDKFSEVFNGDRADLDIIETHPECVICGNLCENKFGNNPEPLKESGRCCDKCNRDVIIARVSIARLNQVQNQ